VPCELENALLQEIIAPIVQRIPNVQAVYLFGSAVSGQTHPGSDIDVAVIAPFRLDTVALWELGQEMAARMGRDVDLVDLGSASTVMRAQVIAGGRRIYCAEEAFCEVFEDTAYKAYARLNEERRAILEDIKRRGSIYGR